jgi:hypothetical protein
MPYRHLFPLLLTFLLGCASGPASYKVRTYADDFAGVTTWRLEGNTVTDTIQGDHYVRVEFDVQKTLLPDSVASYSIMIGYLSSDWLFIAGGESLVMLVDGERIGLTGEGSAPFRQVGSGGVVSELAFYPVSRELLGKIGGARDIRIKVIGENFSIERGLSQDNIGNVRKFFVEH